MPVFLSLIVLAIAGTFLVVQNPRFGRHASAERRERISRSPNFKNGSFENVSYTPVFAEDASRGKLMKEFLHISNKHGTPREKIPSIKTDLHHLDPDADILIWFGHSSWFMQIDGKRILADPVLSGHASPFSFTIKAFPGSDLYKPGDIPDIDYLILSHDHWDHMDYETLKTIRTRVKMVICGLGTGENLEYWGYDPSMIRELDWNEEISPDTGFSITAVTSRHFSGRLFRRNQSLWTSFILQSPSYRIFMGCDGGYDVHFSETGKKYGRFDLALLENGQYNLAWRYIHTLPEEFIKEAKELNADRIVPLHSGKFKLANHPWDEPLRKITEYNRDAGLKILTPMIGEPVDLKNRDQSFTQWWENVK